ncbi:Aste57867_11702 [Aphanomyces stellatus]|uniref:Aste57867_11702 protein n=1 Tax=Aphanomyces stellatus TaxID=120398 RepID=A0A485KTN7_9STRA|nr:hypothetical protein As57867_011659 [Aphanomyces stellatus]VFT88559.1 Aste57867_11702 [Aphanomyces stellatus]
MSSQFGGPRGARDVKLIDGQQSLGGQIRTQKAAQAEATISAVEPISKQSKSIDATYHVQRFRAAEISEFARVAKRFEADERLEVQRLHTRLRLSDAINDCRARRGAGQTHANMRDQEPTCVCGSV